MARFYLHLTNGTGFVEDEEGQEFAGAEAATIAAVDALRDVLAAELRQGRFNTASFIEITDDQQRSVGRISVDEAVRITNGFGPPDLDKN